MTSFRSLRRSSTALVFAGALALGAAACAEDDGAGTTDGTTDGAVDDGAVDGADAGLDDGAADAGTDAGLDDAGAEGDA